MDPDLGFTLPVIGMAVGLTTAVVGIFLEGFGPILIVGLAIALGSIALLGHTVAAAAVE